MPTVTVTTADGVVAVYENYENRSIKEGDYRVLVIEPNEDVCEALAQSVEWLRDVDSICIHFKGAGQLRDKNTAALCALLCQVKAREITIVDPHNAVNREPVQATLEQMPLHSLQVLATWVAVHEEMDWGWG